MIGEVDKFIIVFRDKYFSIVQFIQFVDVLFLNDAGMVEGDVIYRTLKIDVGFVVHQLFQLVFLGF